MSILSTNTKLIKVGQDYSAGSGISIDDKVISVTGGLGNTYSAGENISIYNQGEQLYISSKDWTNDIANASANAYNAATAQIPDPFDPTYLSAQIDNKLNSSDFTAWQNGQYTTDLQTIESQISNKLDESAFSQVSGSFLTAINIPESAVWQDVSTTVQTNSAQWAEGGSGDDEVNALVHSNSGNWNSVTGKQDSLIFGNAPTASGSVSSINGSAIIDDYTYHMLKVTRVATANLYRAITSNSGNWNTVTNKLDATAFSTISGDFLTAAPYNMATTGDVEGLAHSVSETYQVKGDYLTTADSANFYPSNNPSGYITGVSIPESATWNEVSTTVQSNSAQWSEGGGLTGDYVSGVNFVKIPYEEGIVRGTFCSANVSGDVSVTVGEYEDTSYYNTTTYSLSSLGPKVNDKLNASLITDSKTLREYENRYEVFEKSYRHTGTATASADNVTLDNGNCYITFEKNSRIKNATIIIESDTEGIVNTEGWYIVSYENNSATLTKSYGYDAHFDLITFNSSDGWNVTNCDATCTTYSGIEVAELAFKDEIPSGGAISSYATAWCHDVPPYGDSVIERLNDKYLKAFISNSADNAKKSIESERAKSANYAEAVNETYVENKGFTRNLSSEYGTISVIHNNIIESTNSAISRVGNEGFVSSFDGASIGPEGNGTVIFSWDKSLPNTTINLDMSWSRNEILTYSANTDLTGEIVLPTGVNTQTINIPNATEFKVWSNIWIGLNSAVVSAADQFETTVGELAWASALPTYEYDNTNKISAINGSALAGGSDSPSGTMNVSGLEYNAVNEISAYNGSAIAQYGAEKQWLVHDDTLVHAANSAQYALGVNLSAVAQLLGVDETVLFTSSWNDKLWNVNLSEPISSFKKIRMYVTRNEGSNELKTYEYETDLLTSFITLEVDSVLTNDIYKYFTLCKISGATYTELSARIMHYPNSMDSWISTNSWCHPIKIVGIGRKGV